MKKLPRGALIGLCGNKIYGSGLSQAEKIEFKILKARLELEESEEDARIEQATKGIEVKLSPIIMEIKELTNILDRELKK